MSALALSADSNVVGRFADNASRDAALAALPAGERPSAIAFVTSTGVWSAWDGAAWKYLFQPRLLAESTFAGPANVTGVPGSQQNIVNPVTFTLPTGTTRQVRIEAAWMAQAFDGTGGARAYVTGNGIGSDGYMQQYITAVGPQYRVSGFRAWAMQLSGTQTFNMAGLYEGSAQTVSFTNLRLSAWDFGPV
jgi:hypothetical protein